MRRTGALIVAACIPFGIPLVQSYGGEAIYRVYLYSLPLMVGFVAWGIVTRTPIERRDVRAAADRARIGRVPPARRRLPGRPLRPRADQQRRGVGGGNGRPYIAATVPDPAVLAQFAGTYPGGEQRAVPVVPGQRHVRSGDRRPGRGLGPAPDARRTGRCCRRPLGTRGRGALRHRQPGDDRLGRAGRPSSQCRRPSKRSIC